MVITFNKTSRFFSNDLLPMEIPNVIYLITEKFVCLRSQFMVW
jgi:hypothetical protein